MYQKEFELGPPTATWHLERSGKVDYGFWGVDGAFWGVDDALWGVDVAVSTYIRGKLAPKGIETTLNWDYQRRLRVKQSFEFCPGADSYVH